MDQLIEFIMSNLVYVVIVLGVITSIIGKARGGASKNEPTMPSFGGEEHRRPAQRPRTVSVPEAETREYRPLSPSPSESRPAAAPVSGRPLSREMPMHRLGEDKLQAPHKEAAAATKRDQQQRNSPRKISDATSPIYQHSLGNDLRKQALQGMMWAEVFNRPRALRSHAAERKR